MPLKRPSSKRKRPAAKLAPELPRIDPTRIVQLEQRQADLERRIAKLEEDAARQVPWWQPATPTFPPVLQDHTHCGTCGGKWADMTHYVCHHPECPSRITCQPGSTQPYIGDPPPGSPGHIQFTCGGTTSHPELERNIQPPRMGPTIYGR